MCGGNCCNTTEEERQDANIQREINRERKKNVVNLILLGIGGAGKTTFLRQMQIIHNNGFATPEEASKFTEVIFLNIFTSIKNLTNHMDRLGFKYNDEINQIYKQRIQSSGFEQALKTREDEEPVLSAEFAQMARSIWEDDNVAACFDRRTEITQGAVMDNLPYFMTELDRISGPEYVPSVQDILNSKKVTKVTYYQEFELMRNVVFRVTDVGGQRKYRRVWYDLIRESIVIIFLASMSDYDQTIRVQGDDNTNCFVEAIAVFRSLVDRIPNKSVILYLNKEDLLQNKISQAPLENFHRHYNHDFNYRDSCRRSAIEIGDLENAKHFMRDQFVQLWPTPPQNQRNDDDDDEGGRVQLYPHFMTANNTEIVREIYGITHDVIIQTAVESLMLM